MHRPIGRAVEPARNPVDEDDGHQRHQEEDHREQRRADQCFHAAGDIACGKQIQAPPQSVENGVEIPDDAQSDVPDNRQGDQYQQVRRIESQRLFEREVELRAADIINQVVGRFSQIVREAAERIGPQGVVHPPQRQKDHYRSDRDVYQKSRDLADPVRQDHQHIAECFSHKSPLPYLRAPKSAVPMRTNVAPSSIATSKSSLMPIERSLKLPPAAPARRASSRKPRRRRKKGRASSGLSENGGTAINPLSSKLGSLPTCSQSGRASSGAAPVLDSSPPRLTSMKIGRRLPDSAARRSSRSASFRSSTDWTASKSSTARRALFDCRCPIRCHWTLRSALIALSSWILAAASWMRF